MTARRRAIGKPAISMTKSDHVQLMNLAESIAERDETLAEQMFVELERSQVIADIDISADIVRMGSTVRYTTDHGEDRTVTLVYPADADIAAGRVSILTPIGAALIGLGSGQSIDWMARDGCLHRLTVEAVANEGIEGQTVPPTRAGSTEGLTTQ